MLLVFKFTSFIILRPCGCCNRRRAGVEVTLIKPLASSAVHPFCISPYSPNLVFTKSSSDSTPTVEKEKRTQFENRRAVHIALALFQHRFNVSRITRFEILAFVQEHAVPIGHLIFPILLPLAQCILFRNGEPMISIGAAFEIYAPFNADDCIAPRACLARCRKPGLSLPLSESLEWDHRIFRRSRLSVHLFEGEAQLFATLFLHVLQIEALSSQSLRRVENFSSADGCSP